MLLKIQNIFLTGRVTKEPLDYESIHFNITYAGYVTFGNGLR